MPGQSVKPSGARLQKRFGEAFKRRIAAQSKGGLFNKDCLAIRYGILGNFTSLNTY